MRIFVNLLSGDNEYLTYPCPGLLEILETGMDGSVVSAVFRCITDGRLGPPVSVRNVQFEYNTRLALTGGPLVLDLYKRQQAGDETKDMPFKVVVVSTREVLDVCRGRRAAELFCAMNRLQIESIEADLREGQATMYVYAALGTATLAKVYKAIVENPRAGDMEVQAILATLGLNSGQLHIHMERRRYLAPGGNIVNVDFTTTERRIAAHLEANRASSKLCCKDVPGISCLRSCSRRDGGQE